MFKHAICDNPFAYVRDMLTSLFSGFDYDKDKDYQTEKTAADTFTQEKRLDPTLSTLLCDIAQQKLRDKIDSLNRLDAKRDSFAKFAAGMIVFLVAASKAFAFPLLPFKLSIVCFLISALVFVLSRRVIDVPSIPPIQDLRAGIGHAEDGRDWLSASLHKTCEGYTAIENVVAHQINFGLFWLIAGLGLVTLVAMGFQPSSFISS